MATEVVMEIGVRELRDSLSRHLAEVQDGHTIVVTDHGRPIARIVPIDGRSALERLQAEGRITRPTRRKSASHEPVQVSGTVSDLIDEQRR